MMRRATLPLQTLNENVMMRFARSYVVFIFALPTAAWAGLSVAGPKLVDLSADLEPVRREYDFPALAAAVILNGKLHALGVVGMRRYGSDVPAEPNDPFHLGSCTKAMTASLVALLIDEGRLDWTDTLADYFPEFADSLHRDYRAVTLMHLLSHRAGLPSMTAGFAPVSDDQLQEIRRLPPRAQRYRVARIVLGQAPVNPPGEQYLYSNAGYSITGAVIEKVMDEPWENLIRRRLFAPLGIKTVGFGAMGTPGQLDAPWQHTWREDRLTPVSPGPDSDNPPFLGPGGRVHCSMTDWARYVQAVLKACRGETGLLPVEPYAMVKTPPFGGSYALGWKTYERSWGGHVLTHNGTNTMNYAVAWVAPEPNFAVLVATNRGGDRAAKGLDEVCGRIIGRFLRTDEPGGQ